MGYMGGLDATNAACAGRGVDYSTSPPKDAFFPERGTAQITARDAKRVCNGAPGEPICPIRSECLEYALANKERFGIWGGKSERERARIAKDRRLAAEREARRQEEEAQRLIRRERALRAWQTRRRRAVEQQEQAAQTASRSRESSATTSSRRGRRVAA